jgi:hypothetical protein
VNFVPQGAELKGDGKEAGTTPKIVDVAIGIRLNSAKRVSIQGSSRLKLLRVMRPAEVSATNWAALRTIPSSSGTGRFYPGPGFDQRYASSGTHRWEYSKHLTATRERGFCSLNAIPWRTEDIGTIRTF